MYRNVYGKVRWEFEGDVYRAAWPDQDPYETTYSLRSLDGPMEELTVYWREIPIVMEVEPTQTGFCVQTVSSGRYRIPKAKRNTECFARYNESPATGDSLE